MTNQSSTKLTRKKPKPNQPKKQKINQLKTQTDSFYQNQVILSTCVNLYVAAKSKQYEDGNKQSRLTKADLFIQQH